MQRDGAIFVGAACAVLQIPLDGMADGEQLRTYLMMAARVHKNTGFFKDPVCESAFAMVDMCHNTEIADMIHIIVHEHLRKDVLYVRACFHFRESGGQYWHGALRCT